MIRNKKMKMSSDDLNVGKFDMALKFSSMSNSGLSAALPEKKKMVIKPLKTKPQVPDDFESTAWEKIKASIIAIQTHTSVPHCKEELYNMVEDICIYGKSEKLYEKLYSVCENHIRTVLKEIDQHINLNPAPFLNIVANAWKDYCTQILVIRNIFLSLDRSNMSSEMKNKITSSMISEIKSEREGNPIDRNLLQRVCRMLHVLEMYNQSLEHPFLEETAAFYIVDGRNKLSSLDVPSYLKYVENSLANEAERVDNYLELKTKKRTLETVENLLLKVHNQEILDHGLGLMLDERRLSDLSRMYGLFKRVRLLDELKKKLVELVKYSGSSIISNSIKSDIVPMLLDQRQKLDEVLSQCFCQDGSLTRACGSAWEDFINVTPDRPPEFLAKFVDTNLQGKIGESEEEIEALLDRVMVLFRYIQAKDVFESFYKAHLAKRLLLNTSSSRDLEFSFISKLKAECGGVYTSRLEGMFRDVELCSKLISDYDEYLTWKREEKGFFSLSQSKNVKVDVRVLTMGYWPSFPKTEAEVPPEIIEHIEKFTEYYSIHFQGKRIAWQHNLGQCVIKTYFENSRHEFSLSQMQTSVLLLCFNKGTSFLSLKEIKAKTNIEEAELCLILDSLSTAKVPLLLKALDSEDDVDSISYRFNTCFTHKNYRIKLNILQLRDTPDESERTHVAVFRDREYQIDAAIVRILKSRKIIKHQILISELLQQLKFPAKPMDLKLRIESLIEREYLERDSDNPQVYVYVA